MQSIAAGATLAALPWPMFRHDPQHTGRSPYNGPQAPVKKWEFATGDYVQSSPAIGSDGTVYVGSRDAKLYALNPDGSKKWEFATGGWVQSSPAIGSDGTVYLGSQDNKLYAIGEYTVAFSLQAGWNMISVPLVLENPSPEAVFPSGWPLYRWEPLQGRYAGRSEITLAIGKGYWLKAPTPYNLSITGQPNMEDSFTISLSQGWNLIGTPYEAAIGWSTVRVHKALVLKNLDDAISAGWIKSPFYRWTGSIYAALGSGGAFQPKAGYWVNVLAPGCTLTFIR